MSHSQSVATPTTGRWGRLAHTLSEAGFGAYVDEVRYPGGVSRSIAYRLEGGRRVEIHDKWTRGDNWAGWQVHLEDSESIELRSWPITRRKSEVVEAVRAARAQTN